MVLRIISTSNTLTPTHLLPTILEDIVTHVQQMRYRARVNGTLQQAEPVTPLVAVNHSA